MNTLGITGGVKVIFEHANMLTEKGYQVELLHVLNLNNGLKEFLKALLKKIKYSLPYYKNPKWFKLNESIIIKRIFNKKYIKNQGNDIVIATANETADFVNSLKNNNLKKFYFIQDYESWTRSKKLLDKTYLYNLRQITTTKELADKMRTDFNVKAEIVENGVDKIFFQEKKRGNDEIIVLSLYHPLEKKGFSITLKIIKELKQKDIKIKFIVFGAYHLKDLHLIDDFYFKPSKQILASLYKKSDIFLYTALEEAWGMTLLEAAASQCAIISTRVGWAKQYGIDNKNIIFIEKDNYKENVKKIINLIKQKNIIKNLGINAQNSVKNFSWKKSNNRLEKFLLN